LTDRSVNDSVTPDRRNRPLTKPFAKESLMAFISILATAAEEMALVTAPKRITRPDGAVVGCSPELDVALQPTRDQLVTAVQAVMK